LKIEQARIVPGNRRRGFVGPDQNSVVPLAQGDAQAAGFDALPGKRERPFQSAVRRLAKEAEAEQRRKHPTRDPRAHGNDFKRGCGFRIAERLNELRAASTSEGNRTKLPALYLGEDEGAGKYASRVFGADEKVALVQRHEVTVGYLNGEAAADRIEIEQKQLSEC
jgi:hypothetical protein